MTLLSDIIDGVDSMPVAALLRKVKILASRLDQRTLTVWASNELDGYPDPKYVPIYRGPQQAEVIGLYRLPFTTGIAELPIPPMAFPVDQRDSWAFKLVYFQPIAELEELAKADGPLRVSWPANFVAYTNSLIRQGTPGLPVNALLVSAYRPASPQQVQGVVDAVRSRLLDLALGLERLNPHTGEQGADQPSAAAIQPVINNIYGGNINLAQSSSNFTQSMTVTIPPRDEEALLGALERAGLAPEDVEDLRNALHEDRDEDGVDPEEPGPRVQGWLGRMTYKAAGVGGNVAVSATGGVVAGIVKQYFHIA